jgi:hypothetical protein
VEISAYLLNIRNARFCLGTFLKLPNSGKFQVGPVHEMNAYWGVEIQLHWFLTSKLDGGE